ncbi:MAG TPA: hypothetical protein VGM53_08420 [Streptosporangiaceae bacterium]
MPGRHRYVRQHFIEQRLQVALAVRRQPGDDRGGYLFPGRQHRAGQGLALPRESQAGGARVLPVAVAPDQPAGGQPVQQPDHR